MAVNIVVGTNSYISLSDAQTYFDSRLFADSWDNATGDERMKALIMACKKIDRQPLVGRKASVNQTLEFPRIIYSYDKNAYGDSRYITEDGYSYMSNSQGWITESEVSNLVKDAVCEEALAILETGNSNREKMQRQGVKSFSIGNLSETFSGSPTRIFSQETKELLRPYLAGSVGIY